MTRTLLLFLALSVGLFAQAPAISPSQNNGSGSPGSCGSPDCNVGGNLVVGGTATIGTTVLLPSGATQAAFQAAINSGANVVCSGTIAVSSAVTITTSGHQHQTIGGPCTIANSGTGVGLQVNGGVTAGDFLTIDQITITGNSGSSHGLYLNSCYSCRIHNVTSTGNGGDGVHATGVYSTSFEGGSYSSNLANGLWLEQSNANKTIALRTLNNTLDGRVLRNGFTLDEGALDSEMNGGHGVRLTGFSGWTAHGSWLESDGSDEIYTEILTATRCNGNAFNGRVQVSGSNNAANLNASDHFSISGIVGAQIVIASGSTFTTIGDVGGAAFFSDAGTNTIVGTSVASAANTIVARDANAGINAKFMTMVGDFSGVTQYIAPNLVVLRDSAATPGATDTAYWDMPITVIRDPSSSNATRITFGRFGSGAFSDVVSAPYLTGTGAAFASLGSRANGSFQYCTNCNTPTLPGATCATGGDNAGAWAMRARTTWLCF